MNLEKLKALALRSATNHGHAIGPWRRSVYFRDHSARCEHCGALVVVAPSQQPQIYGRCTRERCHG